MIGVVEPLVSALFEQLFNILLSHNIKDFFKSDDKMLIDQLKTALLTVDAVLSDAEEKQFTNPAVKRWLIELKNAAYDAEDLLDRIHFDDLKRKLEIKANVVKGNAKATAKKVMKLFDDGVKGRLETIVESLEHLANQRDLLNLKQGSVKMKPQSGCQTSSLLDESEVFGRDKDKEVLMEYLLDGTTQEDEIPVIAILGIPGIGKTALAQLLYNDSRVRRHFGEFRAWVHVSEEFDVCKVTRKIFESVVSRGCQVTNLSVLQDRLQKKLSGKRFLLVLDDIWNENLLYWNLLLTPLKAGARGSRIIVTTRNQGVTSTMPAIVTHCLPQLTDEDCWSLFAKHAFRTRNPDQHPNLRSIGGKIVSRCKGLPLAAKTLGCLLQSEGRAEQWRRIRDSKIWDLANDKNNILPALRLSYDHLHPHLKRCFAYCSMFPKGYEFRKEKLILLWMAEGFLPQQEGEETIEETGDKYFHELLSRSFFQASSHKKSSFVMHDLVNDLAQFASGEICCKFEDGKPQGILEKARHITWLMNQLDGTDVFEPLHEVKSMRTFLLLGSSNTSRCFGLSKIVSDQMLANGKYLRVLSFSGHAITNLPGLCNLIHLRYLDLSNTLISQLPSGICSLYKLQTLLLSSCYELKGLPSKIRKLVYLRHLDLSETNLITKMPSKFGKLKNLQELTDFFVGEDSESSKISELGELSHLRGKLSISRLENVDNVEQASKANLKSKNYLCELVFRWTANITTSGQVLNEKNVLNNLRPHENLEKLTIENYSGRTFPDWLGDDIFSNMVIVRLTNCSNCESLPSLGQLSSLQELYITKMHRLTSLQSEFYRDSDFGSKPFRSLKILSFQDLPCWTQWTCLFPFPSLKELKIQKCPALIGILPERTCLPCLEKLELCKCPKLSQFSEGSLPLNLQSLIISYCDNLTPQKEWGLHGMVSLDCFEIKGGCTKELFSEEGMLPDAITSLSISTFSDLEIIGEGIQGLTSLKTLQIDECAKIKLMPAKGLPPNLQSLVINNCNELKPKEKWGLNRMATLTCFEIKDGCSGLDKFPKERLLPNTLTTLCITNLPDLKILGKGLSCLTSLKMLKIEGCDKLELMPQEGLPPKLQSLSITNCESIRPRKKWGLHGMESLTHFEITGGCSKVELFPKEGLLPNNLISLRISRLPDLKHLVKGLQHLTSLKKLEIKRCEKLESIQAQGLPTSLCSFHIQNCPLLAPRCKNDKGEDWHKLSQISDIKIYDGAN